MFLVSEVQLENNISSPSIYRKKQREINTNKESFENIEEPADSGDDILEESFSLHNQDENSNQVSNQKIRINWWRTISTHKKCVVCKTSCTSRRLRQIKSIAIIDVFFKTNLIIPFGARACLRHFDTFDHLTATAISMLRPYSKYLLLKADDIQRYLKLFKLSQLKSSLMGQFESFSFLPSTTCESITGN